MDIRDPRTTLSDRRIGTMSSSDPESAGDPDRRSSSRRLARLLEIFTRAVELEGVERDAYLTDVCADDAGLRLEVEVLLADEAGGAASFLEPPSLDEAGGGAPPGSALGIGDFEVVRELGRGGAGVVHLARQRSLDRMVALKVLATDLTTTPEQIERFRRESQAIAKLDHPGIVRVYSAGVTGSNPWFAMEFVEGRDLASEICLLRGEGDDRPFLADHSDDEYPRRVARLVADAARALAAAHRAGVVHRDVKPSNLLLDASCRVRLADFGIARDASFGTITRSRQVAGTVHYMSPEQARIETAPVDHRTDVYSLGVVLYELLTLRRPFTGATDLEVLAGIKKGEPPPIRSISKSVPRALQSICHMAMAVDVRQRYQSATALADDLERFLRQESVLAGRFSTRDRVRRFMIDRLPVIVASVAIMGLLLLTERVTRANEEAPRIALVGVDVVGSKDVPAGDVRAHRLDRLPGTAGESTWVGRAGDGPFEVEPGYYRFTIDLDGFARRYSTVWLGPGESIALRVRLNDRRELDDDMVRVEGGTFFYPSASREVADVPESVAVRSFEIDRHEVSNAEYRDFARRTRRDMPSYLEDLDPRFEDYPVVQVTWEDALAYAEWAGKRLPTSLEWVWLTDGATVYPEGVRGTSREPDRLVLLNSGEDREGYWESGYFERAVEVDQPGAFPSELGLRHLWSNVAEWHESPMFTASGLEDVVPTRGALGFNERRTGGATWAGDETFTPHGWGSVGSGVVGELGRSWMVGFRCARDVVE